MKSIMDSPALKFQAPEYPLRFDGKVPSRVRMTKEVKPDILFFIQIGAEIIAKKGKEYPVWVNSYGACVALLPNLGEIGIKPDEFEVVDFH